MFSVVLFVALSLRLAAGSASFAPVVGDYRASDLLIAVLLLSLQRLFGQTHKFSYLALKDLSHLLHRH
jgi:hypothetical protein